MLVPTILGVTIGGLTIAFLLLSGMVKENSSVVIILVSTASFYPVFAVENGGYLDVAFYLAFFLFFLMVAWIGYLNSAIIVGLGFIAHAVFDAATMATVSPAPLWWPYFCLPFNLTIGIWWLYLNRHTGLNGNNGEGST